MEFSKGRTAHATQKAHAAPQRLPVANEAWVGLVRRYLKTWGLSDEAVVRAAAERLVSQAALDLVGSPDADAKRTLVSLTRAWVEAFAREEADSGDWFWRAQALLARYPHTFLTTPIPRDATRAKPFSLLPDVMPRLMIQQHIVDPLDRVTFALRDAKERLRGGEIGSEPRPLIEPTL